MSDVAPAFVVPQLRAVLREAFEGPQAKWTYFIDNRPDAAVFGTVDGLSAEQASKPSGAGASTIASHVHHLCFSVAAASAWIRGDRSDLDWKESWRVRAVDAAEWTALKKRLRGEYEELLRAIDEKATSDEEAFGGAVGMVAHAAYHLGAIRQKIAAAAAPSK
jgi:DinB family protein